jgi:hypothetical protein
VEQVNITVNPVMERTKDVEGEYDAFVESVNNNYRCKEPGRCCPEGGRSNHTSKQKRESVEDTRAH